MNYPDCPQTFSEIAPWAKDHFLPVQEANRRYTQLAVLRCIAADPVLSSILVFRGAGALTLYRNGRRCTGDMDFLILAPPSMPSQVCHREAVREQLNAILNRRLPDYFQGRELWDQWLAELRVDLTPCPYLCDCTLEPVTREHPDTRIKVCTIEMLVAQKLVGVLTPDSKGRWRPQDIFDVAAAVESHRRLDLGALSELIRSKAAHDRCEFSLRSFTPQLQHDLAASYPSLTDQVIGPLILFDTAWKQILGLVAKVAQLLQPAEKV